MTNEHQRFRKFIEDEGFTTYSAAEFLGTTQSNVAKYQTGALKIPLKVVKTLHLKLRMNYTWYFHGVGTSKVKVHEQKKLFHDVKDLEATIAALLARQEKQENTIRMLARDLYDIKHKFNSQNSHVGDTK